MSRSDLDLRRALLRCGCGGCFLCHDDHVELSGPAGGEVEDEGQAHLEEVDAEREEFARLGPTSC